MNNIVAETKPNTAPLWQRILAIIIVVLAVMVFVTGIPGLGPPTCKSLSSDVVQISKDNAGLLTAKVIDVVEIETVSTTDAGLSCRGIAVLSNTMKQNITYKSYKEYDKWWVKFEPDGLPFQ